MGRRVSALVHIMNRKICLSVCLCVRPIAIFFYTERVFDMRFFAKVSLMMRFCNVFGLDFKSFVEIFRNDVIATWLAEISSKNVKKCKKSKIWRPKIASIGLTFGVEVGPNPLMTNHPQNRRSQLNCAEGESNNGQKWVFWAKSGVHISLHSSRTVRDMENRIRPIWKNHQMKERKICFQVHVVRFFPTLRLQCLICGWKYPIMGFHRYGRFSSNWRAKPVEDTPLILMASD